MQVDPGKPTGEARLLNLAMKVILVVAIAVIVSIVIIAALLSIPPPVGSTCCDPLVQFGVPDAVGGGQWEVWVAGVSETRDLEEFKAILLNNGTVEDEMDPLTDGLITTHMFFIDLDGSGRLTSGDFFVIRCGPGSSYRLSIIWKDSGNERGRVEWET